MNKGTIITDAISYIEELQKNVDELSDQLRKMEATCVKDEKINLEKNDAENEMKIKPEIEVIHINGTKLWIKIVMQKKRGVITRLMEIMSALGFDLIDTSITTSKGAVLVTFSAEGIHVGVPNAAQMKEFLFKTINNI
ncbi:hypothetical protein RD792_007757 [Penstemon davidsonii]|uniref:ACT domain-containing protein n=1 Tax=Penstemon davidsonii TaxID=160366 RepID=A0ABR0D814_9LAMI|nr:hypothetical protein RD792_007757 [Penstemon davidsonii]